MTLENSIGDTSETNTSILQYVYGVLNFFKLILSSVLSFIVKYRFDLFLGIIINVFRIGMVVTGSMEPTLVVGQTVLSALFLPLWCIHKVQGWLGFKDWFRMYLVRNNCIVNHYCDLPIGSLFHQVTDFYGDGNVLVMGYNRRMKYLEYKRTGRLKYFLIHSSEIVDPYKSIHSVYLCKLFCIRNPLIRNILSTIVKYKIRVGIVITVLILLFEAFNLREYFYEQVRFIFYLLDKLMTRFTGHPKKPNFNSCFRFLQEHLNDKKISQVHKQSSQNKE